MTSSQALSLWSGSADSKTPDCQRTNPRYQQWELTQRKPLGYKAGHNPTTSSILCGTPYLNNKQNKNTNPITSRQDDHLIQPCPLEEKQTNKNSAQISSYVKLTRTTGPTLVKFLSCVQLFTTPWTIAYQDLQSMGFSRQGYWSGLPFPSTGDLPDPGIESGFPAL